MFRLVLFLSGCFMMFGLFLMALVASIAFFPCFGSVFGCVWIV